MNFFKYQNLNFSNRAINIEVPHITDPRSNVLQTLYSQSNDEIWIESWLQQNSVYKAIPKVKISKGSTIGISEAQSSLRQCLLLLDSLTNIQQDLQNNFGKMSSTEWKQKTVEIGKLKDHFTRLMSKFEDGEAIFALKRAIDKRKHKRLNSRKRKTFQQQQIKEEYENRKKLHKDIDQWLLKMKQQVEDAKREEEMQKDADCVLSEVTKKKSDARKQISLLSSLAKLRSVRDQMATQRGEKVSLEDRKAFNITTEKLMKIWGSSLKIYSIEEQGLRLMLEKTANEDSKTAIIAKERKLLEEWHNIFFGPKQYVTPENTAYWALTAAERGC
ncbi:hypothetical protein NQ317_002362 [Molorchus minor]|uniref:Programmed cell death protein 7 n=1 Tax=Molorchus minor TaxID=1323400 RepID=A0ABQ9JTZ1_9CUCU|nr:hypothetical protein NQ317_002362 [Molorchus minor]